MMDSTLPALAVFGIMFAIAVIGLIRFNASAARNNGSDPTDYDAPVRRDDTSRFSGTRA